ncbi:MAG: hypothetical protein LBI72_07000 [Flavobacteriaceae bacterium]|jgi:hypothetical protein|nr:hypothetical protein [Flavobacteriaceae bacterium]
MFNVRRFLLHSGVFAILAISQAILSMYPFKEELACDLATGFYQEVLLLTLIISLPYLIVYLLFTQVKRLKNYSFFLYILGVLLWFFQNLSIFESRVACWSTFTTSEAINYTLSYSFIPILIATVVFVLANRRLQNSTVI